MSDSRRRVARAAVLGGGVVLVGALVLLAVERDPGAEPSGVLPHITRDAGPRDGGMEDAAVRDASLEDEIALSRLDGAVQLFLPAPGGPEGEVITPEEMRVRHRAQIELIEQRIEELERQPASTIVETRLGQLRARRDELRALLDP